MARSSRPSNLPPEPVAQILAIGENRMLEGVRNRPPSRRRPQRGPETFLLRIDLVGAKPPIWRRVEVPSTLMLDEVHDLLQLLFGWYDSHLHRFALGTAVWDPHAEYFLNAFDVEEGEEEGTPEVEVRLDETLAEPGDVLRYCYDYGDDWSHTLKLEKVTPGRATGPACSPGSMKRRRRTAGASGPGTRIRISSRSTFRVSTRNSPSGQRTSRALSRTSSG